MPKDPRPPVPPAPGPLRPGDTYEENGLLVFTAQYLLRRGTCCESGCRHCPFGYRVEGRLREP